METVLGIVIGIVATVAVSHYYFRRSMYKRLSIYALMSNRVFSGIDASVRSHLKFLFHEEEISELQQIELIVANDGERAISNCIQPLRFQLPESIKILDASILHRSPNELDISMTRGNSEAIGHFLQFDFPLLNKGDFFLVKLLVDGRLLIREMQFQIQADDLPRTIKPEWLPDGATSTSKRKVEWAGVIGGSIFLVSCAVVAFLALAHYQATPGSFPWPWKTFNYSWPSTVLLVFSAFVSAFIGLIGVILFIGIGFESFIKRNPKFPLPEELRGRGYALFAQRLTDFDDIIEDREAAKAQGKEPVQRTSLDLGYATGAAKKSIDLESAAQSQWNNENMGKLGMFFIFQNDTLPRLKDDPKYLEYWRNWDRLSTPERKQVLREIMPEEMQHASEGAAFTDAEKAHVLQTIEEMDHILPKIVRPDILLEMPGPLFAFLLRTEPEFGEIYYTTRAIVHHIQRAG